MASFLTGLFGSIFTPGPTPTLITATNVSFASLQVLLLVLFAFTYSIHFAILSFLSAGLWWAINWFVRELQAATEKEKEAKQLRDIRRDQDERVLDDSGTETEPTETLSKRKEVKETAKSHLQPEAAGSELRKRTSLGEGSGDLSTDSEWDKVEEEEDIGR